MSQAPSLLCRPHNLCRNRVRWQSWWINIQVTAALVVAGLTPRPAARVPHSVLYVRPVSVQRRVLWIRAHLACPGCQHPRSQMGRQTTARATGRARPAGRGRPVDSGGGSRQRRLLNSQRPMMQPSPSCSPSPSPSCSPSPSPSCSPSPSPSQSQPHPVAVPHACQHRPFPCPDHPAARQHWPRGLRGTHTRAGPAAGVTTRSSVVTAVTRGRRCPTAWKRHGQALCAWQVRTVIQLSWGRHAETLSKKCHSRGRIDACSWPVLCCAQ